MNQSERRMFEKVKDMLPFITLFLMMATIAFTYYTYFYDVHKTPQLILQTRINKIDETDEYYITKITLSVKNQSKSRVEVIGNQGKLFGFKCDMINHDSIDDKGFMKKIQDTTDFMQNNFQGNVIEVHRNLECLDGDLLGFYQPFHNDSWLQPEELFTNEMIAAVPRVFDIAKFSFEISYSLNDKYITSKYKRESNGDINYRLYLIDSKDSTNLRELNYNDKQDQNIYSKYDIIPSGTKSELWLSARDSLVQKQKK